MSQPPVHILAPAPSLRECVAGYWFVQDLAGDHAATPIATSPVPYAVLSVNFGRPNLAEGISPVPQTSLLGLQARVRTWTASTETYFVMAMLEPMGLVRLLPHAGATADALVDLGAMLGDREASGLGDDLRAAWDPTRIVRRLDAWFIARLHAVRAPRELPAFARACAALACGTDVATAARLARCDRRALLRWCVRHLGIGPKALMDLHRVHESLRSVQRREGCALEGFADAPHQIRAWRRRLGTTPGAYARSGQSVLAQTAAASDAAAPAFYL